MSKDITVSYMEKNLIQYGIRISAWAPGDGWTRYRITDLEGGREFSQNMTMVELRAWFRGYQYAKTNYRW